MSNNSFITLQNLNTVYTSVATGEYQYKGTVANISDLPAAELSIVGNIYTVTAKSTQYVCLPVVSETTTTYEWRPAGGIASDDIDTTPGGTSGSTKLITSGAVNAGFTTVGAQKADDIAKTTESDGEYIQLSANSTIIGTKIGPFQKGGSYVPTTRTVNDKALSSDITLTAADVGAAEATHSHSNYVPTSRTIAGNSLSSNITTDTLKTSLGLGSAAYTDSSAYATADHNHDTTYSAIDHNHDTVYSKLGHTHDYLPLSGGTVTGVTSFTNTTSSTSTTTGAVTVSGGLGVAGNIYGAKVFNAVWNDLADCIEVDCDLEYGKCYCFDGEHYHQSSKYMDDGIIGIHSDTYGFEMGHKSDNELKCAVAGFVLAYVDRQYKPGTPLTATSCGMLTEMHIEDKRSYPEKIVGTYWKPETGDVWNGVKVNNRHWIKIR